ncbi:hypothetical protein AAG570_013936 [Ranatra chinensis]|uniref:NADH dehydrogenase [ubiquinone] iron-sulfur protein 4, mitochondrial n=1 Tax=Ranatra chinensis TaxID=642074 RepID=A0ABD0YFI8_9HEMI
MFYSKNRGGFFERLTMLKEAKQLDPKTEEIKHTGEKITVRAYEDVGVVSGVPEEYFKRNVYIGQRGKHVMQQGTKNSTTWILKFDNQQKWMNPLIGYKSTGDCHAYYKVQFDRREEAIEFARRQRFDNCYRVNEPHKPKFKVKAYRENYLDKRTRVSTK